MRPGPFFLQNKRGYTAGGTVWDDPLHGRRHVGPVHIGDLRVLAGYIDERAAITGRRQDILLQTTEEGQQLFACA
jgi:hypothetical protein